MPNSPDGFRAALETARSAVRIFEKVGKLHDPSGMGKALNLFAVAHHKRGELDHARKFYLRALASPEATYGPDHQGLEPILENFAELERERRHPAAAEKLEARRNRLLDGQAPTIKN